MMRMTPKLAVVAALLAGAPLASAQDAVADAQPASPAAPWSMTWTDPVFEQIAGLMIGSWKTTGPVGEFADPTRQAEVVMSIAPAKLSGLPDALYVETARADSPEQPYRSAFVQFYRRQGEVRLRTLEVRAPGNPVISMMVGLWVKPEFLPDVPRNDLIATLDLQFDKGATGWAGQTPYPYPTAVGGAVEMTSSMELGGDRIRTADRGYGADGAVLWGPAEGEAYEFVRTDPYFSARWDDRGATIITLRDNAETKPYAPGDRVAFQYSGWVTTGRLFDTSRRPGKNPLSYIVPSGSLIPGWAVGTDGMSLGDWCKFIVGPELGYGPRSAAGGGIPPNSTLVFEAECVMVEEQAIKLPEVINPSGN
ncbi:MAG: FKBP-type peptidyl-prolyl cis-trans isomerase [Phycisphaerales bacterium]|nr:FKBP-type peptidyl-prolyl cis-trans isomerase [Phycisphaerales bacterium]